MAVGPDGARVAWCREDGTVLVFDASRSLLDWWPTHLGSPSDLDDRLTDWLRELVAEPAVGTLEVHVGAALCVDFSPAGTRIATGGRDGMVRIWDARTFEQLLVLRGHRQYAKDLLFSPDGTLIASASGDKTIRLWDTLPLRERRARAAGR